MKIVLFGFHENRGRSVIQRMPDMLAHMKKREIMARPKQEKELAAEFWKIRSNLNQIARYFHMGGIHSKAMQSEIHDVSYRYLKCRKRLQKWQVSSTGWDFPF